MIYGRKPYPRFLAAGASLNVPHPAVVAAFACGCAVIVMVLTGRPVGWRTIDLEVYRAGAQAVMHGRDIYTAHPPHSHLPFTYPPFAAVSFIPMALLGSIGARAALTAASAVALVVCIRLSVRAVCPEWSVRAGWTAAFVIGTAALLLDPVYSTMAFGQVNLLLMALVLVDVLAVRTPLPRGVLIGLATAVKLTPGIFIVYLAVTGRFRASGRAVSVVAATFALGFLVAPESSHEYWTHLVFEPGRIGGVAFVANQSLHGVAVRLAGGNGAVPVGWALAAVAALVVGMTRAARAARQGDELLGVALCGITGLLVSPISWNHHWVWALPVALVLWVRCLDLRAPGRLAVATCWTAVFYLAPIWWVPNGDNLEYTHHGLQLLAANSYLLAGLLLLARAPLLVRHRVLPSTGPPVVLPVPGEPWQPETRRQPEARRESEVLLRSEEQVSIPAPATDPSPMTGSPSCANAHMSP